MARRRPRIYPRTLKNGEVRYDVSFDFEDAQGQRRQQMRTFKTEREARFALADHEARRGHGQVQSLRQATFAACAEEWLEAHQAYIRVGTYTTYNSLLRTHILPELGSLPTGKLTMGRLEAHYRTLARKGVGAGLVRNVHQRCVQILRWAAVHGYTVDASALQTKAPRYEARHMTCWSDEQIERFLAVADQSSYGPLWRLAVYTGMRRGELMGLRWQDIDWEQGQIRVVESRTLVGSTLVTGPTKNGESRTVSVPASLLAALHMHRTAQLEARLRCGEAWRDVDLVFTNGSGGTIHPYSMRYNLDMLVAGAGLAPIRIHDLRHTHASFLLRHGKSVAEVSQRLGHKNQAQTLNVYAHCIPDEHKATAELLGQLFG